MAKASLKRDKFITAYLETSNATEAARRAGYSTPNKSGPRLLDHPEVKHAIDRQIRKLELKRGYTVERLSNMAQEVFDDPDTKPQRMQAINTLAKLHRLIDSEQPQAPNITLNLQVVAPDDDAKPVITIEPAE